MLPVADGVTVEAVAVAALEDDPIVLHQEVDFDSGSRAIVRLAHPDMRVVWEQRTVGFNRGWPVVEGGDVYLSAIGFAGRLDLATGAFVWQHGGLYDNGRIVAVDKRTGETRLR